MFDRLTRVLREQKLSLPMAVYDWLRSDARLRASDSYWRSIKGIHEGKRGFVIGNGPSLRTQDLERLNSEITIASNKIYLIFQETSWRPSYFTVCDPLVWLKIRHEVGRYVNLVHTYHHALGAPLALRKKIKFWRYLGAQKNADGSFSKDFCLGAYGGGTVTYENLQLAVHLGLNPIYIIGCDHFYSGEENISGNALVEVNDQENHFIKNYRKPGEVVNSANLDLMNESYRRARSFAEQNGIKIYNATRRGHLEIFERADFDEVLRNDT